MAKINLKNLNEKRVLIKDVFKRKVKSIEISGFVHEIRDQSKIKFILIRDATGIIQCIVKPEQKKIFNEIIKIPRESVLKIRGEVKPSKQALGGAEILVADYEVLSKADSPLPISVVGKGSDVSLPKKLDWRWIELRKPKNLLIFTCYQGEGSLGRRIQRGEREINYQKASKVETIPIQMDIEKLEITGHSDRRELMSFISHCSPRPKKVIVVHGESSKCLDLARSIHKSLRVETTAPRNLDVLRLK